MLPTPGPAAPLLPAGRYTRGALAPDSSPRWAMSLARVSALVLPGDRRTPHHGPGGPVAMPAWCSLGLGRRADGGWRTVHAVVLPRGKSLDQCAEILQKRTRAGQAGVSKPQSAGGRGEWTWGRPPPRSVFDFLNEEAERRGSRGPRGGPGTPGGVARRYTMPAGVPAGPEPAAPPDRGED